MKQSEKNRAIEVLRQADMSKRNGSPMPSDEDLKWAIDIAIAAMYELEASDAHDARRRATADPIESPIILKR